jgi:perosamine synthetase
LQKVKERTTRRQAIAKRFDEAFARMPGIRLLRTNGGNTHAHHLYVIRWTKGKFSADRDTIYSALQAENIGVNLHYIPLHLHAYHGKLLSLKHGDFPVVEEAYDEMLTLPLFSSMSDRDMEDVIKAVQKVHAAYIM